MKASSTRLFFLACISISIVLANNPNDPNNQQQFQQQNQQQNQQQHQQGVPGQQGQQIPTRRFEYKLSFKGPNLVFKDGTVPFWEHSGAAIASKDQIRITPSIKSQKGRIWSKQALQSSDWEAEIVCRVNGRGRVGADGMAIWFTEQIGTDGPVFGSNDHWKGLAIFLDSFDNDGQQNNPYISVMVNDGTKKFDHGRDGITQQLGGCLRDFRNKPFPVRIKVEYKQRALTVLYHNGLNSMTDASQFEICTRVENVELPHAGHFGVSAATGGLADDHDVLSFITHSLHDPTNPQQQQQMTPEETHKYEDEYAAFLKQLEEEKVKYGKAHPEQEAQRLQEEQADMDEKKVFENTYDKEFGIILQGQNQMHQLMRGFDAKISEIMGRSNHVVSMLSAIQQQNQASGTGNTNTNAAGQQQQQQQQQQPQGAGSKAEITQLLTTQGQLQQTIQQIYASVSEMHRKTNVLHDRSVQQQQQQPPVVSQQQAGRGSGQADASIMQSINDGIKQMKFDMTTLLSKNRPSCPQADGACLSSFFFTVVIGIQSVAFGAYFMYKNRNEAIAKKFY